MYIQIEYSIHFALQIKKSNVCFDARNIELLKDLCIDKRTQIFAIKSFCKAQIFRRIIVHTKKYTYFCICHHMISRTSHFFKINPQ